MERRFNVYKGLQKPLVYRGFAGKFIYWGIGSLLCGLVLGTMVMALFSMLLGVILLAACIGGGLSYTLSQQKRGLHLKSRSLGTYHFQTKINSKIYEGTQRIQAALYRHR
ncbi:plasmid transfer protein [Pedobacter panaciterrae]|uniref:plasmid transfer protein n=1 Tax=Pedobacter panaciterrae TaxID=363849 RepID=UPI001C209843|nr:plasmid transfer protein [Pedobacter panaciterrae]